MIYNSFLHSYDHPFIVTKLCNIYSLLNMSMKENVTGSSVHGILQARILEWLAILFGSF